MYMSLSYACVLQALEAHLRCWVQLTGQHGIVCVDLPAQSGAPGLPASSLGPVLEAWRAVRGLPEVSMPDLLRAAAAAGLMPRLGSNVCMFSRCDSARC